MTRSIHHRSTHDKPHKKQNILCFEVHKFLKKNWGPGLFCGFWWEETERKERFHSRSLPFILHCTWFTSNKNCGKTFGEMVTSFAAELLKDPRFYWLKDVMKFEIKSPFFGAKK